MLLLSTYFVRSGVVHGGHTRRDARVELGDDPHPHAFACFWHVPQMGIVLSVKPSSERPPTYLPKPSPTPKTRTKSASRSLGVSLIGIIDAIRPST